MTAIILRKAIGCALPSITSSQEKFAGREAATLSNVCAAKSRVRASHLENICPIAVL